MPNMPNSHLGRYLHSLHINAHYTLVCVSEHAIFPWTRGSHSRAPASSRSRTTFFIWRPMVCFTFRTLSPWTKSSVLVPVISAVSAAPAIRCGYREVNEQHERLPAIGELERSLERLVFCHEEAETARLSSHQDAYFFHPT